MEPLPQDAPRVISALHRRRLREVWRSAGWPCQDLIEAELLAAGLLQRLHDGDGRESLRVTDAGIGVLAATRQVHRAARDAHEALVARVAREMQRAGRVVWRGLSLRAKVGASDDAAWAIAMPDVYSIRHTTVEDYVEPVAHEIKVHRADLLADLRRPEKGQAYLHNSSQCWYVLREGIGEADEIPPAFGVMMARDTALEVLRPAPQARVQAAVRGLDGARARRAGAVGRRGPALARRAAGGSGRLKCVQRACSPSASRVAYAAWRCAGCLARLRMRMLSSSTHTENAIAK